MLVIQAASADQSGPAASCKQRNYSPQVSTLQIISTNNSDPLIIQQPDPRNRGSLWKTAVFTDYQWCLAQ